MSRQRVPSTVRREAKRVISTRMEPMVENLSKNKYIPERFIQCDKYGNVSYKTVRDSTILITRDKRREVHPKYPPKMVSPAPQPDLVETKGELRLVKSKIYANGASLVRDKNTISPYIIKDKLQASAFVGLLPENPGVTLSSFQDTQGRKEKKALHVHLVAINKLNKRLKRRLKRARKVEDTL